MACGPVQLEVPSRRHYPRVLVARLRVDNRMYAVPSARFLQVQASGGVIRRIRSFPGRRTVHTSAIDEELN